MNCMSLLLPSSTVQKRPLSFLVSLSFGLCSLWSVSKVLKKCGGQLKWFVGGGFYVIYVLKTTVFSQYFLFLFSESACTAHDLLTCRAALKALHLHTIFQSDCICTDEISDIKCHQFYNYVFKNPCLAIIDAGKVYVFILFLLLLLIIKMIV